MRQKNKMAKIWVKFWSRSFSVYFVGKSALRTPAAVPLLAAAGVRKRSRRGGMLGRFRCLEAPEQQPEGEKDDLEHCDGKGKDRRCP